MEEPTVEERVAGLVLEYAQTPPEESDNGRIDASLSLRRDLSIDSLSLVALTLRLGDELKVDLIALGIDLSRIDTVGDLITLGRTLLSKGEGAHERSAAASRG